MSDPFSRINNAQTTAGDTARNVGVAQALEAKQKIFKKKKSIEEGLSGFKAIASVKKIGQSAVKNFEPYIKQEAKAGYKQFKDQWSKELQQRAEGYIKPDVPPIQMGEIGDVEEEAVAEPALGALGEPPAPPSIGTSAAEEPASGALGAPPAPPVEAAEPESDATGILPEEVGEAGVSKVGSTLNPFKLGGEGARPAASVSSKLEPIVEQSAGEERAASFAQQSQEIREGLQTLKTQQQSINDGLSRLGNSNSVTTPGNSAADEASAAAKQVEQEAGEKADQALADKLAAKTAEKVGEKTLEKTAGEDAAITAGGEDAAVTLDESVGGFLDETGILAPLGLLIGAVGLGTAVEDAKKKMPKFNPTTAIGDAMGGTSFQSGIN
tara:strand:- start:1824 stop:2969 length:1146 start_codon:yes stop_codon:yes gene_type:complete